VWANWRSQMPIDLAELDARLKVIDWRDRELAAITRQLEAAFPTLLLQIQVHVAGMSALQITRAS
jgi:transposase